MLKKLDELYREFATTTECDCLILETDDMDLNKQVNQIKIFLGINEEWKTEDFCAYT